jgi:hypothetical protein
VVVQARQAALSQRKLPDVGSAQETPAQGYGDVLREARTDGNREAPQLVKPYVKRGKNDAADAEALCEAMSRPTMHFVPVKTAEQQSALMLVGNRPVSPAYLVRPRAGYPLVQAASR